MATPQRSILTALGEHQWYVHLSRTEGANLGVIKSALADLRHECEHLGVSLGIMFGPTLLKDLTKDIPDDFQPYPGYKSADGKEAKATQEELLVWLHSDHKDRNWDSQYKFRTAVTGRMAVASPRRSPGSTARVRTSPASSTGRATPISTANESVRSCPTASRGPAARLSSRSVGCTTSRTSTT